MGKKIPKLMAKQEKKFKEGCLGGGMDKYVIDKLWNEIVEFAQYGFNKAHSASYGRIAYQTAWLKANYPAEYMSALLSTNDGDTDKVYTYVNVIFEVNAIVYDTNEIITNCEIINKDPIGKIQCKTKSKISYQADSKSKGVQHEY